MSIVQFTLQSTLFKRNVLGTFHLLESIRSYWNQLPRSQNSSDNELIKSNFKFIQISTDEVFGSLEFGQPAFTEQNQL
jgi:dTDP-glucose 4,6-dehydratase